ncbi:hypothetical protein RclHR1_00030054 [Rhizophagus clarus]|uniref:Uncharacterized protein n=1 Tax=Rhizophagus clarus TaxID=94130 RepID=A0A2Z6R543_9GLOM|nr:hypothetical protein RclHR1_00030054 [Rhizophagus clarus]
MRLKSDYEDAFKIMDNGTIRATNDSIMKVQGFLIRYHSVLRSEGLEVRELDLESAGRREIEVINKTKKEMIKLALVTNPIYIKACKALDTQPNPDLFPAKFTDIPNSPKSI